MAFPKDSFHLNKLNLIKYKLHPSVVMVILNHHQRRQEKDSRVVGLLLGKREGKTTVISNCFPVPHKEKEEQVQFDAEILKKLKGLHQLLDDTEVPVGWYSTVTHGVQINYPTALIDENFGLDGDKRIRGFCHLTIDTSLTNDELRIQCYEGRQYKIPEIPMGNKPYENLKDRLAVTFNGKKLRPSRANVVNGESSVPMEFRLEYNVPYKRRYQIVAQVKEAVTGLKIVRNSSEGSMTYRDIARDTVFNFVVVADSVEVDKEGGHVYLDSGSLGIPFEDDDPDEFDFYRFHPVPLELVASQAEKIGLDVIIKSPADDPQDSNAERRFDDPSSLLSDMDQLETSLCNLIGTFDDVATMINRILTGEKPEDRNLAWKATEALVSCPEYTPEVFAGILQERINDLMMVKYLANVTKSQSAMVDKITGVIN